MRKSVRRVRIKNVVLIGGVGRRVVALAEVDDARLGPMIELTFADGSTLRRTPTAKVEVSK